MPLRPRLLDLYCKAGGAARGYADAGFEVVGVDIEPQPNYPFAFYQEDALWVLQCLWQGGRLGDCDLEDFVAIHASPPCQARSDLRKRTGREYPELVPPTRRLLAKLDLPYVIENVEGTPDDPEAELVDPIVLCGTMFPGLRVLRHRLFECSGFDVLQPDHPTHPLVFTHDKRKAHYGKLDQNTSFVQVTGGGNATVANKLDAMGIDWMTNDEVNEAIPPAYAEYVGRHLMAAVA